MNTASEALAAAIDSAARLTLFYTEDLKGNDWLHRVCPKANCAAWTLGHLILTSRMMMARCGPIDLPQLPAGFEARFARDETAAGASDFGDTGILRPLFQQHHERFADVARDLPPAKLAEAMDHPRFKTIGAMLAFAPTHIAMHAGQISLIRRSLGRPPLV